MKRVEERQIQTFYLFSLNIHYLTILVIHDYEEMGKTH